MKIRRGKNEILRNWKLKKKRDRPEWKAREEQGSLGDVYGGGEKKNENEWKENGDETGREKDNNQNLCVLLS